MLFIVAPAANGMAIDRLANLPPARRTDAALSLVELRTSRLPIDSAELDKAPDHWLGVGYQRFIVDFQHRSREHRLPMVHQAAIVQIIAPQRAKVARELQVIVEGGEVARRARVQWVAAAMNDPRVGEQDSDQPEVHKIKRHLVRDSQRGRGNARQLVQVSLGMTNQGAGIEGENTPGVAIRRLCDFGSYARDGGQLAARRNLRMTGEDLFDEGRSGSRHADDEDCPGTADTRNRN